MRGKWIAWSQGIANALRKLASSRKLGVLEGLRSQVSRWQKPLRGYRRRRAARLLCQLAHRAIATLRVNYCTYEYDIATPRAKRAFWGPLANRVATPKGKKNSVGPRAERGCVMHVAR